MKPYYEHRGIVIYHGDCRELIDGLTWDCGLTDPPYGVGGERSSRKRPGAPAKNAYSAFADSVEYVRTVAVPVVERMVKRSRAAVTPGSRCLTYYPAPDSFGCVYQPASVGLQPWGRADSQPIFYYGKAPRVGKELPGVRCSTQQAGYDHSSAPIGHPCPKPIRLWSWLLGVVSLPGECVLDPFMGAGTTLRAAKDLGRRAIGIEIEERYCEIAAKRLSQETLEGIA